MQFVGYLKQEFIDKKIATKMSTVDGKGERGQVCGTVRVACVYVHSAYCRASNRSKQWWGDQEKGEEEREERWVEGGREERRGERVGKMKEERAGGEG
jgi:hypothetical protein